MWIAVFKNSSGGELDRVEADSEGGLKERLIEEIHPEAGWTLAKGDIIEIIDDTD